MKEVRILHILDALNYGGVETFIHNLHENISDNFSFDVLVRHTKNESKKRFEKNGGRVVISPDFPEDIINHTKFVKKFFNQNIAKYDIVHIHANSLIYVLPLILLSKNNNNKPKVVLHSHNSNSSNRLVRKVHYINRSIFSKKVDVRIGCSELASKWMFGSLDNHIVYNGIEIRDYKYNPDERKKGRNEFGIEQDEILLGTVGRLTKQKNYSYLLEMFAVLLENNNRNYKLMLIGSGKLEKDLKKYAQELNISNNVIFTGKRDDVQKLLSSIDIYVQPSIYEGFPFTVAEAQLANLPVLVSENVTDEVIISPYAKKIELSNNKEWLDTIQHYSTAKTNRNNYDKIKLDKVDIKETSKQIEKIYWDIV